MHYSRVTGAPRLGASLKTQVRALAEIARRNVNSPDPQTAIEREMRELWLELLREHGCTLSEQEVENILGKDLELNTQGLLAWLERQKTTKPARRA
jgi:hypothetical protein